MNKTYKREISPAFPRVANAGQYTFGRSILTFLLFAAMLAGSADAFAQATGSIEGYVSNMAAGTPMGRAKVTLGPVFQEVLTDDEGYYRFAEVVAGKAEVQVSYLGFEKQTAVVTVTAGATSQRDFALLLEQTGPRTKKDEDVVVLDKFSVVADQTMTAQAMAMNEQRHAANIKNVVAFEELGEQGMENIGNYMRFLPGVVIMDSGENAGTVGLGGFGAEFTNVQLDGASIASTGVDATSSRTLTIKDVPMVNVDRIEVSKVPTPDMPASGLGGSVNVITKSMLGTRKTFFTYRMYMNFNTVDGITFNGGQKQSTSATSPSNIQPSFDTTLTFPLGKRLAFSFGVSRTWTRRPTDNTPIEDARWNLLSQVPGSTAPRNIAMVEGLWNQNASISTTENAQMKVELKLSHYDTITLSVQRRDTAEKKATNNFVTRFNNSETTINNIRGDGSYAQSGTNTGRFDMSTRNNQEASAQTSHLTMQYQHLGPKWRVTANASLSDAQRQRDRLAAEKGYFTLVTLQTDNLTVRGDGIDKGDSILPLTYTFASGTTPVSFNPYDGDSSFYNIKTVNEGDGIFKEKLTTGRLDIERLFNSWFSMKAGAAYSRQEKDDIRRDYNYTFSGVTGRGTSAANYDLVDESIDVRFNGNKVRWISPAKAYALFAEHPDWFSMNATVPQYNAQNSKYMKENIAAAYLRFDFRFFQNRLNIVSGVRYEKTELFGLSMKKDPYAIFERDPVTGELKRDAARTLIEKKDPYGNTLDGMTKNSLIYQVRAHQEKQDYDDYYPSININYVITDNLILRAAYARTIGRPDIKYVVAGVNMPDLTEQNPEKARSIYVGNPALKPWTSNSFHLSLDSYNIKGGFGTIGVYRKYVTNFFAQYAMAVTPELMEYYSIPSEEWDLLMEGTYRFRRWENAGDAHLTGLELSYRQNLFFLPGFLKSAQVWVNYTHLSVEGNNSEDFVGFTPNVFSCGINLIRPKYSIRLSCAYQAETKKQLEYDPLTSSAGRYPQGTYLYQGSYTKCGLTAEYALAKELRLFVNCDNIFADDRFQYRRAPDTPSYATRAGREVTTSYIVVGIKGSF